MSFHWKLWRLHLPFCRLVFIMRRDVIKITIIGGLVLLLSGCTCSLLPKPGQLDPKDEKISAVANNLAINSSQQAYVTEIKKQIANQKAAAIRAENEYNALRSDPDRYVSPVENLAYWIRFIYETNMYYTMLYNIDNFTP